MPDVCLLASVAPHVPLYEEYGCTPDPPFVCSLFSAASEEQPRKRPAGLDLSAIVVLAAVVSLAFVVAGDDTRDKHHSACQTKHGKTNTEMTVFLPSCYHAPRTEWYSPIHAFSVEDGHVES